jgi:glycosyltransferase involved in cell wall biosynthesis
MRICIVGKYPPIQGGVSAHTYWLAQTLAALGHEVHVVTNANEVEPRFRVWMRPEDWRRCESDHPSGGFVRVHWTDAELDRQRHIPWSNPFVTKLASAAARAVRDRDLELIFSYYLEPYGVAGHLSASMTGRPHVTRLAGSDFGRLRKLAQFQPLYDHVLSSAARVAIGGVGRDELAGCRIEDPVDDHPLPEGVFGPEGEVLDVQALAAEVAAQPDAAPLRIGAGLDAGPYLGIYGKISEPKGTFDLLPALAALRRRGREFHLLAMAHGWGGLEERFHEAIRELGLDDCVTQLPFLPPWRVPAFARRCQAVCFLERDFPIAGHVPAVPREVLASGRCLVASAPILRSQSQAGRLVHLYNCIAVKDVRNVDELAAQLEVALGDPHTAGRIGALGHHYSRRREQAHAFPRNYERLFADVIDGRAPSELTRADFPWCQLAGALLEPPPEGEGEALALTVYTRLLKTGMQSDPRHGLLLDAVRFELHTSELLIDTFDDDGLFRLRCEDPDRDLTTLRPAPAPGLTLRQFDHDVAVLAEAYERGAPPWDVPARTSWAAFLPGGRAFSLTPEAFDLLRCCDGNRTIGEMADELGEGELRETIRRTLVEWFEAGLIALG